MKFFKKSLYRNLKLFHASGHLLLLTVGYHLALYLSTSNTSLLILTALYGFLLYAKLKNVGHTLLLLFLTTLPFAKGKGIQIILLPQELIPRYSLFKISYFFPLYLSDFVLFLATAWYVRERVLSKLKLPSFPPAFSLLFLLQGMMVLYSFLHVFLSPFREVIFLSALQFSKMMLVTSLPFFAGQKWSSKLWEQLITISAVSLGFQAGWALLQAFTGGPLGKHIEAVLPGFEGGIVASETGDLMRVNGTFYEPSILGTFLIMNALFLLAIRERAKGTLFLDKLGNFSLILSIVALIFTGSRGLYVIALLFGAVIVRGKIHFSYIFAWVKKNTVWLLLGLLIVGNYLQARVTTITDIFTRYGTASYRISMVEYAVRIGLSIPMGVGLNMSPYTLATGFAGEEYNFDPTYPHNIFAQVFAELGIIGVCLLVLFIYLYIREARATSSPYFYPVIAFFLAAQLYPIFLNHQEILGFFYLFIGMTFWTRYAQK